MKVGLGQLLLQLIAWSPLLSAASSTAHFYVYNPDTPRRFAASSSVSAETARLIIARRLGLSQFHSVKGLSADGIQQINDYGGSSQSLFGDHKDSRPPRALIWIEGVADVKGFSSISGNDADFSILTLSNPPPPSSNAQLIADFAKQAAFIAQTETKSPWNSRPYDPHIADTFAGLSVENFKSEPYEGISLVRINSQSEPRDGHNGADSSSPDVLKIINNGISTVLAQAKRHGVELTIALLPPSSNNKMKRAESPYGNYEHPPHIARKRELDMEKPLSASPVADLLSETNKSHGDDNPGDGEPNTPVRGILPACFASTESCESATKNCSGHGTCQLKYNTKKNDGKICYVCACKAEVKEDASGSKKTTHFGGPACQKKDVSLPFWLLAGFSVVMMFVISWGVGLLYSVGEEPLPSVIGAGVAGPRPK